MGTSPISSRDSIRDIDGIMASVYLQVSPDGGTLNNAVYVD